MLGEEIMARTHDAADRTLGKDVLGVKKRTFVMAVTAEAQRRSYISTHRLKAVIEREN
jgi:hypothetical protein